MMRLVPLATALLLASACGGGSTVTVTHGPPQTSTAPTPSDHLRAYLTAMLKAEHQWNHAERVWKNRDRYHRYAVTAPWPKIGRKLSAVRRLFHASAAYVASVTPPPGLAKAHQSWLSSITLSSAEVDNYVTGFEAKDVASIYRLDNSPARDQQIDTVRTKWRLAVLALAKSLSVPVPKALRRVGTGY
jgi:hypothetical protein